MSTDADAPSIEALAGGAGLAENIASAGLASAEEIDRLMAERGALLGRALALMANMLDPEAIVLGGGVALSSPAYFEACREAFHRTLWHRQRVLPPLVPAALGADAGLVGAGLAVRS
jgi:glucokinase